MQVISVEELKAKIDAGESFHLIDVREPHEFEEFNLKGRLIPLGSVPMAIANGDLDEILDDEIVVHCRSGARSMTAQAILIEAGAKNVSNLTGGVLDWIQKFGA